MPRSGHWCRHFSLLLTRGLVLQASRRYLLLVHSFYSSTYGLGGIVAFCGFVAEDNRNWFPCLTGPSDVQDALEIEQLLNYLIDQEDSEGFILVGHSTGCQVFSYEYVI